MAITWRNINAPDFTGAAAIQQQGADNLQSSLDTLQGLVQERRDINIQQEQDLTKANTFKLLETVRTTSNMEDYEKLSLNTLLSSVGGNADEEAVYKALLNQDDEIFNQLNRENKLASDELAIAGQEISNTTAEAQLDKMLTETSKENRSKLIDDAATNYGMDLYSNKVGVTDREAQDLARVKGESLGYKGTELDKYISKVTEVSGKMLEIKDDESPFVQLASDTVGNTYNSTVATAEGIKNRVYEDNPLVPTFDIYADITTESDAISSTVEKFPAGWAFGLNRGKNLQGRIEETVRRFEKDAGISKLNPQVLAASLKLGEGITTNEELLGNDQADISNLYRTIQKYYDMHELNEVRKQNRRDADKNLSTTIGQAAKKRDEGMLDIYRSKGNIDNLTTMIKSYQ